MSVTQAETSAVTRTPTIWLVVGGVLAGLALCLELYLGVALTAAWFWPWPPAWVGVIVSILAGAVGPVSAICVWRSGQRMRRSRRSILARAEIVSGNLALLGLLVLVAMIFMTAI